MAEKIVPQNLRSVPKHGHSNTPTHRTWVKMKARCQNPNEANYPRYGGAGVTVCDRWQYFLNFLEDMGERPEGLTLDRINSGGCYSPENCRWTDLKTQSRNRRTHKKSKSGITGVTWRQDNPNWIGTWRAMIRSGGELHRLYQGKDFFEACCARKSGENKLHWLTQYPLS